MLKGQRHPFPGKLYSLFLSLTSVCSVSIPLLNLLVSEPLSGSGGGRLDSGHMDGLPAGYRPNFGVCLINSDDQVAPSTPTHYIRLP